MLSNLRFPNKDRLEQALATKLRLLADSGELDPAKLQSAVESPPEMVARLPGFNVISGDAIFDISPLFWMTPETSLEAFRLNWDALTDLVAQPEAGESAKIRAHLREGNFRTVRSRPWLMGATREHKRAKLLPVLQMLLLQAFRVAEQPPTMDDDGTQVTIDGREFSVKLHEVQISRAWGGPLRMPHNRAHQFLRPGDMNLPATAVISNACHALAQLGAKHHSLPAMLLSAYHLDEDIDGFVLRALLANRAYDTVLQHMDSRIPPDDVPLTPLQLLIAQQPAIDLTTVLKPGTELNVTSLYGLLVEEERVMTKAKFTKTFGQPTDGDDPRVIPVTRLTKYARWRQRVLDALAPETQDG